MPSWIGPWEIGIVVVIALLVFGPKKLPDLGSSLGRSISGFRKGLKDAQDEMKTVMTEDAEAKVTTAVIEPPVVKTEAASATTAGAAVAEAPARAELPKCWGTWEDGHEACLQCTVAAECADAGRQAVPGA
jgi:sec-independent protein translocase protein TatA